VPLSTESRALLSKVVETWGAGARVTGPSDTMELARPAPARPNLAGGARVDLPDPALHPDEHGPNGEALYGKQRFDGELWGVKGPTLEGVRQGYLSDCYFVAGLASVLHTEPGRQHVANMVKDNGDGTYSVTFKERDRKMRFQDVTVKVDAELYVHPGGEVLYGKTGEGSNKSGDTALFFPIIEKAYASWKGGYEAITEDTAANLYEAVLGQSATHQPITQKGERTVWETMSLAITQSRPITAGTRGEGKELQVQDSAGRPLTIYPEHQYSVFGCREEGGRKLVTLRNPWGKVDRGDDGKTGGVFTLDLATFKKSFASLSFVDPPRH
jgi:Calpain family cysteine protease